MPPRRTFLAACTMLAVALAGCTDADSGDGTTTTGTPPATATSPAATTTVLDDGGPTPADATTPASADATTPGGPRTGTAGPDGELDLREANVTAVEASATDGDYRFDVTLYHDDDGEDGYANWWQVEALDGTRMGRRDLLHPHGTREFTRSATVAIPADTPCVVVRGHDETHGYGGRAALVDVETGATGFVDQGPEPGSFDTADCP